MGKVKLREYGGNAINAGLESFRQTYGLIQMVKAAQDKQAEMDALKGAASQQADVVPIEDYSVSADTGQQVEPSTQYNVVTRSGEEDGKTYGKYGGLAEAQKSTDQFNSQPARMQRIGEAVMKYNPERGAKLIEAGQQLGAASREASDRQDLRDAYGSGDLTDVAMLPGDQTPPHSAVQPGNDGGLQGYKPDPIRGMHTYLSRIAPNVMQTYIKQGKTREAQAFAQFMQDAQGQDYTRAWDGAMRRFAMGDHEGALTYVQELYNTHFPDGIHAQVSPAEDGQFRVDLMRDGKTISSHMGTPEQIAGYGIYALSPDKRVEYQLKQQAESDKASRSEALTNLREDRRDARQQASIEAMDSRQQRQLAALANRPNTSEGKLSISQQARNFEIEAARKRIQGMTPDDIKRRTASATTTGRENPDYDPQLANLVRLANQRKYGDDHEFDALTERQAKRQRAANDIGSRFQADQSMNGYRLGNQTPNGFEVYNQAEQLVGHYR